MRRVPRTAERVTALGVALAVAGPGALTAILVPLSAGQSRDYVFLYLALVAALGVTLGLWPALLAAGVSFLCVDYFFVQPLHTLSIANQTDLVNLVVFFGVAGLVGGLGSRRRSAQMQAEALTLQMRALNDELERRNREVAESAALSVRLAQSQQQVRLLEETDRIRRDFLANVSHELRTPLGSVLTGTTALAGRGDLPAGAGDELLAIAAETRRLARLVGDMLDMTRIDGDALDLQLDGVDVASAVESAVDRMHRTHPQRTVEWRPPEGDVTVVADWDRLGQVLDNLLGNADRFAPRDTPITLRAAPGSRAMVVFHVIDHGPGIADEIRDRVFERFIRGPRPAEGAASGEGRDGQAGDDVVAATASGTGLGLAIVKGLVEAQGGRVWLDEPPEGGGASFAFTLPAADRSDIPVDPP
ncbi:MAG TPA: ATP-binding protein [Candidatus Dormibacteraeota bacterium]|jgi:two-component system sensor histidine kinase KdpD|nr:ATP-binding protein [Candidatus Dormibacteraeota bacterium]